MTLLPSHEPDDDDLTMFSKPSSEADAVVVDIMEPIVRRLRERQAMLEARLDAHEQGIRMLEAGLAFIREDDETVRAHAREHGRATLADPNYYRLGHLEGTVRMALAAMEGPGR